MFNWIKKIKSFLCTNYSIYKTTKNSFSKKKLKFKFNLNYPINIYHICN